MKRVLEQEQARFNNFQRFQGVNFAHWSALLGIPVPTQPRLHISLTHREADRFHLAANDVPGTDVALWRSLDLMSWERVPNAVIQRDGFILLSTDPAPPASAAFYAVRAQ